MKTSSLSVYRSGHGAPIILLHGWGMKPAVFGALVSELEKTREVINVELPGYGLSAWDATMSFTEQAEWIASELPDGEILGWSMGGLYALEMIRQRPKQFNGLLLVCCNPCFVQRKNWRCAVSGDVFDQFAFDFSRDWQATIKRFLMLQMLGNKNARTLVRELMTNIEYSAEPRSEALEFGLNLLRTQDSRSLLSKLNLPIKMMLGGRDVLVPGSLAEEIYHVNPRIEVESLANAAHAPFLSHTAQFLTML